MKYRSKKKWILAFELLLVVLFVVNSLPVSAYEKKMVDSYTQIAGSYMKDLETGEVDVYKRQVYDPGSGRSLAVYTSEPGMQLYTANYLDGTDIGKGGIPLQAYCAFCLETQHFPDSVHQPQFPSAFYRAGEIFRSETEYCFSVDRIPGREK